MENKTQLLSHMAPGYNARQWLVATAVDADSIGLKFDCGVEVIITPAKSGQAAAAPTEVSQPLQLEPAAAVKPHGARSQKKAEVALRREKRFDQYNHLSQIKPSKDHAIYARRAPGAKDASKPVLKLERHSNLSEESDLDADMQAEAAAAAGELEEEMGEDMVAKDLTFEPDVSWCAEEAFALPPPDCLDMVFPLPPSLQSSPCFGPSAPPMSATEALTNLPRLEVTLVAVATEVATDKVATEQAAMEQATEQATEQAETEQATETAEAREEAAAEEAAMDGWVLVSPAQLPHSQGLGEGGAIGIAQLRPTSLLHTLHSLVLGHGAAAVPHGPKEVGAWVFVPPSRLRHTEPSAPPPSPTPEVSACAAAAPDAADTTASNPAAPAAVLEAAAPSPASPSPAAVLEAVRGLRVAHPDLGFKPLLAKLRAQQADLGAGTKELREALTALKAENEAKESAALAARRDYLGAVLQQKPPLPMSPRTKPVRRGLRSPQPVGLRPGSGTELPASVTVERHCSLLEPLAKRPKRDPRPRSILMQRQRAFSMEQRAMKGAMPVAAC